ncbi:kinase-like protein [Calocera cornea HHB12733]|uniref:Kinase-like protein n=1 Tax=Calocera cornea HHB12733 TaxID=1353952 RepID=A0A165E161_9BASI|nr:kinase-like protein [Calocera cornea HHB12733]
MSKKRGTNRNKRPRLSSSDNPKNGGNTAAANKFAVLAAREHPAISEYTDEMDSSKEGSGAYTTEATSSGREAADSSTSDGSVRQSPSKTHWYAKHLDGGTYYVPSGEHEGQDRSLAAANLKFTTDDSLAEDLTPCTMNEDEAAEKEHSKPKVSTPHNREKLISDLIRFGSSFKLKAAIPGDLLQMLAKDEERRSQILEKSQRDSPLATDTKSARPKVKTKKYIPGNVPPYKQKYVPGDIPPFTRSLETVNTVVQKLDLAPLETPSADTSNTLVSDTLSSTASGSLTASVYKHPFFGSTRPKKDNVQLNDDFKLSTHTDLEELSRVASVWPFNGVSYTLPSPEQVCGDPLAALISTAQSALKRSLEVTSTYFIEEEAYEEDELALTALDITSRVQHIEDSPVIHTASSDTRQGWYSWHEDSPWRTKVALKHLRHISASDIRGIKKRFNRELGIWAALSHVNVLPFLGTANLGPSVSHAVCFVSPWMDNGNVKDYLDQNPHVVREALYLHDQKPGLVHGDIKAKNILVDQSGTPLLCDFGLAAYETLDRATTTLATQGTTRWTAPERLAPDQFDLSTSTARTTASDIFSFGMTAYEVISGKLPFDDRNNYHVIFAIVAGQRPTLPSDCNAVLGRLIEDCWRQRRVERPTASQVVDRLSRM